MLWLISRLVVLPVKLAYVVSRIMFRVGYRSGRVMGARRLTLLFVGALVGALATPMTGSQARDRLRTLAAKRGGASPDLGSAVRAALAADPATQHLPSPAVTVDGTRIRLSGRVEHADSRLALVRVASGVAGVTSVDDALETSTPAVGAIATA